MVEYSNAETYLISYMGGSSGAFLTSLVYDIVTQHTAVREFSEHGRAHDALLNCHDNWVQDYHITYKVNEEQIYDKVKPLNENVPFILYDHLKPDWDVLFTRYPSCVNFVITMAPSDGQRFWGNFLYKAIFEDIDNGTAHAVSFWEDLCRRFKFVRDAGHYTKLSHADTQRLIESLLDGFKIPEPFNEFSVVPAIYKDSVIPIKFDDILNKRDKVLDILSKATNRPITPQVLQSYNMYVIKQHEFIDKYIPWVKS